MATLVGAVPGALPPLIGWVAAHGRLTPGGGALFVIVFLWQIPHFMAIAWLYRDDYGRAGFPMLPVGERLGKAHLQQQECAPAAQLAQDVKPFLRALQLGLGVVGRVQVHTRANHAGRGHGKTVR